MNTLHRSLLGTVLAVGGLVCAVAPAQATSVSNVTSAPPAILALADGATASPPVAPSGTLMPTTVARPASIPARCKPTLWSWGSSPTPSYGWSAGSMCITNTRYSAYLDFQGDGNWVLYTKTGRVLWSTKTANIGQYLNFRRDGGIWVTRGGSNISWSAHSETQDLTLQYRFYLQNDDNAVLYVFFDGHNVGHTFDTHTSGQY